MGCLHNIDFGSRNWFPETTKPVTRNRFPEPSSFPEPPSSPDPRFEFRQVLRFQSYRLSVRETGFRTSGFRRLRARGFEGFGVRCSDGLGSVPEVWMEPALGTGFGEPEVLRRFRVPEIPLPRFRRKLLCIVCTKDMNAKPTNPKHNFKHCGFTHPKTNGWKAILGWFVDVCPTSN